MSQKLIFSLALCLLALNGACKASLNSDSGVLSPGHKVQGQDWPTYAESDLAGKVFGADWKAASAIARQNPGNSREMILEFYSEKLGNACSSQTPSSTAYATVVIPADYSKKEYIADMNDLSGGMTGNPVVFSGSGSKT